MLLAGADFLLGQTADLHSLSVTIVSNVKCQVSALNQMPSGFVHTRAHLFKPASLTCT